MAIKCDVCGISAPREGSAHFTRPEFAVAVGSQVHYFDSDFLLCQACVDTYGRGGADALVVRFEGMHGAISEPLLRLMLHAMLAELTPALEGDHAV